MRKVILALCLLCLALPAGANDFQVDDTERLWFSNDWKMEWIEVEGWEDEFTILYLDKNNRVIIADIDLLEILESCREFIDDYSVPIYEMSIGSTLPIYIPPPSRYESLNQDANEEIMRLQSRIEDRKRERKLRQDIETIIKHLGEVK